ncbi:uncharacterized protein LOC114363877 [Ostrinia furnacalis]|uniref:uncharacterized protein LOC114358890 n=1 Tax=Ostrinia furnacalis TaxID=93504 RepID=UPI00103F7F3E|nr:uncharacterized protein LOC114358890 [Ostrinia furnacalis]XP_028175543.1 uncharacterized protein LOC114363877 [Ostrinia furnacalis]
MQRTVGWWCLLLMIGTQALALQLQPIKDNPGILPVKQGQAFLQTDFWTIIKVINLKGIYSDLVSLTHSYRQLDTLIDYNNPYYHEFINNKYHTDFIRDITLEKYRQLVPQQRYKRGLINPLGSLIKLITGNLDHDDALKYDKLTSQLSNNQVIISKKITLVSKMFDSFINISEQINNNSIIIDERLKRVESLLQNITSTQNDWTFSTYILGVYNIFISSFRTIFIRLSEIETALALSRVSILHQAIVNSTELLYHLKLISNSANLVYQPTESNLLNLEETICVKSYMKQDQITFILEIPLIDNYTYNYYKIYSLPIFQESQNVTLSIFPKFPYLLAKGLKYLPIVTPCRPLAAGDRFLCSTDNQALHNEPTCVEQLMRFSKDLTSCKQHQIQLEEVKLQQLNANNWILYSRLKGTLTKHCDSEVSKQSVFGTYIITIDEPCDLEIHGLQIHHRLYISSDAVEHVPVIHLPELPVNATLSGARALNMHGINLDEIKYMSYALKHSAAISASENETDTSYFTYFTFVLVLILFMLIVLIAFRKHVKILCKRNYRNTHKNETSDNFSLREGGVMHPSAPSALD